MKYRLNRQGQELGEFTLEDLRSRRQSGELRGTEWVLAEGASEWKALDFFLESSGSLRSTPPALPASARKGSNRLLVWSLAILALLFVAGAGFIGFSGYRFVKRVRTVMEDLDTGPNVSLAGQPVKVSTNSPTEADVRKQRRAFRVRQYLEGFKRDGPADAPWRDDAILLIESWIAQNHGGDDRTNLPSPRDLGDQLVAAGCNDPLVLTVAAVNRDDWNEATRRLKRAVSGFEQSRYKAYPRMYATATLSGKLTGRTNRINTLDASCVALLKRAFSDGSFLPDDQAEAADIFVNGWAKALFERNHQAVIDSVKQAGKSFEWLALTLEGESHIDDAWRARGSDWAYTVTDQGWKDFADHLVKARKALSQAWELRPDLPFAPSRMISVAMGQSDAKDMRLWFDRATAAQFDYPPAWSSLRWGLRPRWLGSEEEVLALGVMGLNTGRFDTDVPRKLLDAIYDVEKDLELGVGEHIYGRSDIWPDVQRMYEGYIGALSNSPYAGNWRSDYAAVAYLAGYYSVARKQLEALNWQPWYGSTKHWGRDLSTMPAEVAARGSSLGRQIGEAESARAGGEVDRALRIYYELATATNIDARSRRFIKGQTQLLEVERRLRKNEWVDFLPVDENDDSWALSWGKPLQVATNVLEVQSGPDGHLLYSRVNVGQDFESRGEFEVVKSSDQDFQAGLVMGMPDFDTRYKSSYWFAFRMRRDADEGDKVYFSKGWTRNRYMRPVQLNADRNSFLFRYENGRATISVNGAPVLRRAALNKAEFSGETFLVGVCAFGDGNQTVIRYRNLQVRRLSVLAKAEGE